MDCPPQLSQLQTFTTPVATKKKVARRTHAQIEADSTFKKAATAKKSELNAAIESAKKSGTTVRIVYRIEGEKV